MAKDGMKRIGNRDDLRKLAEEGGLDEMTGIQKIRKGGNRKNLGVEEKPRNRDMGRRKKTEMEVTKMVGKPVQQNRPAPVTVERIPSPFGRALYVARLIKGRDDPRIAELREAVRALNAEGRKRLAGRIRGEVMDDWGQKVNIAALFPIAFVAGIPGIAHNTAAVLRITRQFGVSFDELRNCGLIEIKVVGGEARKLYHFSYDNLKGAAAWFKKQEKFFVSQAIEAHLLKGDEQRAKRRAEDEARAAAQDEPEPEPEAEPAPVAEQAAETPAKPAKRKRAKKTEA